jgi:hypothetical protein
VSQFYVPNGTISDRAKLLLDHASELISDGIFPSDIVGIREHRFVNLAEGYFLLNHAYKSWRIKETHLTELPKIAALQCVVISRYQPFFPLVHPVNDADVFAIKPNEMFALSYALGILGVNFVPDTPVKEDFWLRLLDIISSSCAQTLEPYSMDKSHSIAQPLSYYEQKMTTVHADDKPAINTLISIFELMSKKRADLGF